MVFFQLMKIFQILMGEITLRNHSSRNLLSGLYLFLTGYKVCLLFLSRIFLLLNFRKMFCCLSTVQVSCVQKRENLYIRMLQVNFQISRIFIYNFIKPHFFQTSLNSVLLASTQFCAVLFQTWADAAGWRRWSIFI